jgi:hypothetical protein
MPVTCTAPCFPACKNMATSVLLNNKSKAILGQNCPEHIGRLVKIKGGEGNFDYDQQSMLITDPKLHELALKDMSVNLEYVNDGAGKFIGPYVTPTAIFKLLKAK